MCSNSHTALIISSQLHESPFDDASFITYQFCKGCEWVTSPFASKVRADVSHRRQAGALPHPVRHAHRCFRHAIPSPPDTHILSGKATVELVGKGDALGRSRAVAVILGGRESAPRLGIAIEA